MTLLSQSKASQKRVAYLIFKTLRIRCSHDFDGEDLFCAFCAAVFISLPWRASSAMSCWVITGTYLSACVTCLLMFLFSLALLARSHYSPAGIVSPLALLARRLYLKSSSMFFFKLVSASIM